MDVMELRPYDVALTALLVSALRRDPERDAVDIDHDPTNTGHLAKVLHEEQKLTDLCGLDAYGVPSLFPGQVLDWMGERLASFQTVDDLAALFADDLCQALAAGAADGLFSVLGVHARRQRALFGLQPFEGACRLLEELQAEFAAAAAGEGAEAPEALERHQSPALLLRRAQLVRQRHDRGSVLPESAAAIVAGGEDNGASDCLPGDLPGLLPGPSLAARTLLRHETAMACGDHPEASATVRRWHDGQVADRVAPRPAARPRRCARWAADEVVRVAQSSGAVRLMARALALLDASEDAGDEAERRAQLRRAVALGDAELAAAVRLAQARRGGGLPGARGESTAGPRASGAAPATLSSALDASGDVSRLAAWAALEAAVPGDEAWDPTAPGAPADAPSGALPQQLVAAPGAVQDMFGPTGAVLSLSPSEQPDPMAEACRSARAATLGALACAGQTELARAFLRAGAPSLAQATLLMALRAERKERAPNDTQSQDASRLPAELRHDILACLARCCAAKAPGDDRPLPAPLAACGAELRMRAALLRGDAPLAGACAAALSDTATALTSKHSAQDAVLAASLGLAEASLLERDASGAYDAASTAQAQALREGDAPGALRCALACARARYESGDASGAIPETLGVVEAADRAGDVGCALQGRLLLTRLLCHMGHPERAERLARRQLALALAAQSQHAAAEAWLLLAECALLGAGREGGHVDEAVRKVPPRERSRPSVVDSECSDHPCRYVAC
ncbi:hypothetical protein QBZ16_001794 [Prototheca wickerhamii]|uniref:Anaphase-promoting complex subunit 5 n=1 Tax=Prototheca wickerhamii TaxID=3111 RepID=A0AAD9IE11_PROWI|nr:hypothetical protein QBZ16_001794 [Prototheca wickerhamii]